MGGHGGGGGANIILGRPICIYIIEEIKALMNSSALVWASAAAAGVQVSVSLPYNQQIDISECCPRSSPRQREQRNGMTSARHALPGGPEKDQVCALNNCIRLLGENLPPWQQNTRRSISNGGGSRSRLPVSSANLAGNQNEIKICKNRSNTLGKTCSRIHT